MKNVANLLVRLVKEEEGVTMIEYALMAALIALVAITAVTTLGTNVTAKFNTAAQKLQ